jgi:hypothetical protein
VISPGRAQASAVIVAMGLLVSACTDNITPVALPSPPKSQAEAITRLTNAKGIGIHAGEQFGDFVRSRLLEVCPTADSGGLEFDAIEQGPVVYRENPELRGYYYEVQIVRRIQHADGCQLRPHLVIGLVNPDGTIQGESFTKGAQAHLDWYKEFFGTP